MRPLPVRPLTARQTRVVDFIRRFLAKRGYPPTHAEIAAGLRFRSPNAAAEHVRLLARKGALAVEPGIARGLKILLPDQQDRPQAAPADLAATEPPAELRAVRSSASPGPRHLALPVIGEVAAGQPILAQENFERTVAVEPGLFEPHADFLLRVRGDSMIEAGIQNGDLVAVHRTPTVRDGQVAVVRLDDDVTVKRFRSGTRNQTRGSSGSGRRAARTIVLEPANAALQPIVVDPAVTNVAIEGLVVGLVRLGIRRMP